MPLKKIISLLLVCCICSCSDSEQEHVSEKHRGVYIGNSTRYGRFYKDPEGAMHSYRYIEATVTNDSTIPAYVNVAFFEEAYEPTPANGHTFNVFFLEENMTPENQGNDDFYRTKVMPFLNAGPGAPVMLHKVIAPKESCSFNIGFLSKTGAGLEPFPILLFSKDHKHYFKSIPDSAITQSPSADGKITLLLGLDFFMSGQDSCKRYALIPCGTISFSK